MAVKRFGVSLEENILKELDALVNKHQFPNRSQAIRFIIKEHAVKEKWKGNEEVGGTVTLLFDHHKRNLSQQAMKVQHDYHQLILSMQHIHLDHNNCLEMIALKGKSRDLINLSDKLIGLKGVKYGQLVMTTIE